LAYILIVIDSEADAESAESNAESDESGESDKSDTESPPIQSESNTESAPAEYSDWDGFSDALSFDSASDAFTDNHTDSEPEGVDTSWLYTTVEEQDEATAERRRLRRRNRHIQERDRRRLDRELHELKDNDFDTWITVQQDQEQDQDEDQIHAQMLAEIQGQDTSDQDTGDQDTGDQDTSYQDTRPQKRRYSSEALDSTYPSTERRYPWRKRQLTPKAAARIRVVEC
jgi:hypothetical protein